MYTETIKFKGRKQKIQILEWNDVIDNHEWIYHGREFKDEKSYNEYLKETFKSKLERIEWYSSGITACNGEKVHDDHQIRFYFKVVSF